jgi:hypothetical protein
MIAQVCGALSDATPRKSAWAVQIPVSGSGAAVTPGKEAGLKQGSRTGYPAAYHRTHGIRYFHGCYSLAMISVGMTPPPHRTLRRLNPGRAPVGRGLKNLACGGQRWFGPGAGVIGCSPR